MKQPPYLKKGDKAGIIIPAGKIDQKHIDNAISILENWGLNISFVQENTPSDNSFSASDKDRTEALQKMLNDDEIRAIFCARGGYGTIRIIDQLDFDQFIRSPKWVVGFSDITVLHALLNNKLNIQSLHAAMPISYPKEGVTNESINSLKAALFGEGISYALPSHTKNVQGESEGTLIGGNLSILYNLRGTDIDINAKDKVLFIEDVGEYLYHIDRMLMNLKRGGIFNNIKGLIVGGMSELKDERFIMNRSVYDIILEKVNNLGYPVIFDFKAGHIPQNLALKMGSKIKMEVGSGESKLIF